MESKPAEAKAPSPVNEAAVPQEPSSISLLSSSACPTFSIQVPFILLGTPSVSGHIYNHAGRTTRPLHAIHYALEQECSNIVANCWIPQEPNENDIKSPGGNRAETRKESQERRKELEEEEQRRWEAVKERGWIIRHGGGTQRRGWLGQWKEGDGKLTARERRMLPEHIWHVPIVLQQFGIDIRMKDKVLGELGQILNVLGRAFDDGSISENSGMKMVCNHKCKLRVALQPASGVWDINTASKVLLALAAWERELLLADTMTGILSYTYLSRFMTHYDIRQLQKERRRILGLRGGKEAEFDLEKNAWEKEVQQEDIWDTINEPELWNRICDFVKEGDWKITEFIGEMEEYEKRGRRVAVAMSIVHGAPDTAISGEGEKQCYEGFQAPEYPETTSVDEDSLKDIRATILRRPSTPAPPMPKPFCGIDAVVFQTHRSSLDIEDIFAYTDLVTRLVHHVISIPYSQLETWIGSFRWTVTSLEEKPIQALRRLLRRLDVTPSTQRYFTNMCIQRELEKAGKSFEHLGEDDDKFEMEVRDRTPFHELVKLLEKEQKREWSYIPVFISRYMNAGGFNTVTRPKVYALMVAHERKRKVKEAASKEQMAY